jgi:hypothetical protein
MPPGQLCSSLLHNLGIRPSLGKRPHVLKVAWRKAFHIREGGAQVMRQPVDHLGTPTLLGLSCKNVATDLPIQPDQFPINRQRRTLLRTVDAPLQVAQPVSVALRS